MPSILLFGDSNTHGTCPLLTLDDDRRFGADERWPGVMRAALGTGWTVIEEGHPGRTTVHDDPIEGEHRNGRRHLPVALETHKPLDLVVIMLGTNDLKTRFGLPAEDVAAGAGKLVQIVRASGTATRPAPRVLLVAPPPIKEAGCLAAMFTGGEAKGRRLAGLYAEQAKRFGADFFDAGEVAAMSDVEGIHMDAAAHAALGKALAAHLSAMGVG